MAVIDRQAREKSEENEVKMMIKISIPQVIFPPFFPAKTILTRCRSVYPSWIPTPRSYSSSRWRACHSSMILQHLRPA